LNHTLVSTSNFERGRRRLSSTDLDGSRRTLNEVASDQYSFELWGRFRGLRSARFGDHRIVYTIIVAKKQIVPLAVEPRGSVYER
jgi:mRNA-degrading endonuclease RelE of RelBE toxin-antitoxin system